MFTEKTSMIESYVEAGYVTCPGLISHEELEVLKKEAVAIARGKYPGTQFKPLSSEMTDKEVIRNVLCIHQVHYGSPVIMDFVKHPAIAGVLTELIGPSVKCMQSMLFVKSPGLPGQAWHQDENYIPTRDRSLTGGWIAIDDATIENGCLWVIPGSHKPGYLYPSRDHQKSEEFDFAEEAYGFDESEETAVEVGAGTVVFFNGYLLHRSKKNRSQGYRRVLVNHYMNAYSLLPWQIRDGENVATADRRGVVMVSGKDPYAWKGYEAPEHQFFLRPTGAKE